MLHMSVQGSSVVFALRFLPQLRDKIPNSLEETLGGMAFCILTKSACAGAFQACKIVFEWVKFYFAAWTKSRTLQQKELVHLYYCVPDLFMYIHPYLKGKSTNLTHWSVFIGLGDCYCIAEKEVWSIWTLGSKQNFVETRHKTTLISVCSLQYVKLSYWHFISNVFNSYESWYVKSFTGQYWLDYLLPGAQQLTRVSAGCQFWC